MRQSIHPYLRSEIKTTLIASGQYSFSAYDIFQGLVPCQLIVGLVASASYMGDYRRKAFYFRDYDCSSVAFYVDAQSYPSQPLRPNYEDNQHVDCYRMLACFWKDINVKRNDYCKGYCLYVLEIDPYYSFNIKRQGHCLALSLPKPYCRASPCSCMLPSQRFSTLIIQDQSSQDEYDDSLIKKNLKKNATFLSPEEEGHHALGRDAYFSWSWAMTHPSRCNRTCITGRSWTHLGSEVTTSFALKRDPYYCYKKWDITWISRNNPHA